MPTLDEEITKELPKSGDRGDRGQYYEDTEKEIAAAVAEHKEETTQEEQTAEPARPKDFNTVEMQNELANSMRQILSGMRGSKPAAEPEPIPEAAVAATQEEEPEEEQQMEGQMSIDDILTGAAEEPKQSPVSEAAPAAQVEETQPQVSSVQKRLICLTAFTERSVTEICVPMRQNWQQGRERQRQYRFLYRNQ